jgi:hypothetical protein
VFYAPDGQTWLAVATPTRYGVEQFGRAGRGASTDGVKLPHEIQLRLANPAQPDDSMTMNIALADIEINPTIREDLRADLFSIPQIRGVQVVELNERALATGGAAGAISSRAGASSSGRAAVQLGDPAPIGVEGGQLQRRDPMPLDADLPQSSTQGTGASRVVGIRLPRAPEPAGHPNGYSDPWSTPGRVGYER